MNSVVPLVLATRIEVISVPDGGVTALLLSGGVLSLGLFARFMKNRKK